MPPLLPALLLARGNFYAGRNPTPLPTPELSQAPPSYSPLVPQLLSRESGRESVAPVGRRQVRSRRLWGVFRELSGRAHEAEESSPRGIRRGSSLSPLERGILDAALA